MASGALKLRLDGIHVDGVQSDIPPTHWTTATNYIMRQGRAERVTGHTQVLDAGDLTGIVLGALSVPDINGAARYWIYWTVGAGHVVYVTDGTTSKVITPATKRGTTSVNSITSGLMNGVPFWNAGTSGAPCAWIPTASLLFDYAGPTLAANLATAHGWPALTSCTALRAFGDFLIAMRILTVAGDQPDKIMWSDRAASGMVLPTVWTASATNEAGDATLGDGGGYIMDGLTLGNGFMIYKESAAYLMEEVGLPTVMSIRKVFTTIGCVAKNCIQEINGNHIVVTEGDVIQTNGRQAQSIIDPANRRYLFDQIDQDNKVAIYTALDKYRNELWVCFPGDVSKTYCDQALVWNGSKWGHRELQGSEGMSTIASGWLPTGGAEPWDGGVDRDRLVAIEPGATNSKAQQIDTGTDFDGTAIESSIEKQGIVLADAHQIVTTKRVYPKIEGTAAADVMVSMGSKMNVADSYSYSTPTKYTLGTTSQPMPVNVTGRYFALKYTQSTADTADGYVQPIGADIEFETGGRW